MTTPKELKAILKVCQDMRVSRLKMDGLEVELELHQVMSDSPETMQASATDGVPIAPTDEDLMYWSSGPSQQ